MSPTLLRLLDTARQRPLTDDEFETMKDVAVLGMLFTYWDDALQPCAVCGVFRDLHREWRAFVDDPLALAAHQFMPQPAADNAPDRRPSEAPVVAAAVAAPAQTATATTQAATAAAATTPPAVTDAGPGGRRSWRRALGLRLGIGHRRPLSQP